VESGVVAFGAGRLKSGVWRRNDRSPISLALSISGFCRRLAGSHGRFHT
jgi:hypothetical protein